MQRTASTTRTVSANDPELRKLIISTGDVSDVDGFFALAHYATTDADVCFVMNYPGYMGVAPADELTVAQSEEKHYGKGYSYSAKTFIEAKEAAKQWNPEHVTKYLDAERAIDADALKAGMTNMAFSMATNTFNEHKTEKSGRLFFAIGGINTINPFSPTAIKNEFLVYHDAVPAPPQLIGCQQGDMYDASGNPHALDWAAYDSIYTDFNGSAAFCDDSWKRDLTDQKERLKGLFVMGGVLTDAPPQTMPSISNVLNRFSTATMNQLYSPEKSVEFMHLFRDAPKFVVTNNAVQDLATLNNEKVKTFDGVNTFLSRAGLDKPFLRKITEHYYNSPYNPPRKPFDFYTAWYLKQHMTGACPVVEPSCMFINSEYGSTIVSKKRAYKDAIEEFIERCPLTIKGTENDFDAKRIRNFQMETKAASAFPDVPPTTVYSLTEPRILKAA